MAQASRSGLESLLHVIRGQAVLLDTDIAELYGVSTKRVNQAVKRNVSRFPVNFVFRLTEEEFTAVKASNNSDAGPGGRRYRPYAFTEQGAGMLASVLKTAAATKVSIAILRAVKIGSTKNLPVRLRTVRVMFPGPLRLLGVIKGDVEEACHMRFGVYRLRGEWFMPSAALLDFIRANATVPQGSDGAQEPRRNPA